MDGCNPNSLKEQLTKKENPIKYTLMVAPLPPVNNPLVRIMKPSVKKCFMNEGLKYSTDVTIKNRGNVTREDSGIDEIPATFPEGTIAGD
jgi:hypothetical protein